MTTVLESLNAALHQAFAQDERVYLIGEDILDPYGGAFKVSRGLSSAYPQRVLTTPHLRSRHHRHSRRHGAARSATGGGDHVRRFSHPGCRPDHQPYCQVPLDVQ